MTTLKTMLRPGCRSWAGLGVLTGLIALIRVPDLLVGRGRLMGRGERRLAVAESEWAI